MKHSVNEENNLAEAIALFRYGLIASIVRDPPRTPGVYHRLRKVTQQTHNIPGTNRNRIALDTIRKWVTQYRAHGFDGLYPKQRHDRGKSRKLSQSVVDGLLELKDKNHKLSVKQIIYQARDTGLVPAQTVLPPSTVHRLFERAGLMNRKEEGQNKDRRRFSYKYAGELLMSDVMHGPAVLHHGRRKKKTYLIAFLDDATRVIPHAQFCWSESTADFLPVFKKAVLRRGIPKRLYVDNGAVYRCRQLALVCAKLGITLIHARPYQPQGKGKIERYFRTVRQWLRQVELKTIEGLNRSFWAWVECEYHLNPHRGLDGRAPIDRWVQVASHVQTVSPQTDLDDLFLWEVKRRVRRDRVVSLNNTDYEVAAELVGQNVVLRYEPGTSNQRPIQIWHDGKRQQDAKIVDAYANCFVKRDRPSNSSAPSLAPGSGLDFTRLQKGDG